jgi:F-type H+-transporting ATPase subunit epsilon
MADMQFDLVSPERSLASMQATSVQIPGADGDMTVMADHAPTITTLRPGMVRVDAGGTTKDFVVSGGFAEITAAGVSVLAERAVASADMTQGQMDAMFDEAQAVYDHAKEGAADAPGSVDDAAKLLADMTALSGEVGLNAKALNV